MIPGKSPEETQQPSKKRKLEPGVITVEDEVIVSSPSKLWLPVLGHIMLTEMDRNAIITGEMLNDNHINVAQKLLKIQFEELSGLHSLYFCPD